MKKQEKKMILTITIVGIIIISIIWGVTRKKEDPQLDLNEQNVEEFVEVQEDGTKLNISSKLNEMKNFNGLKFGNIRFSSKNSQSLLIAEVQNNTGSKLELTAIDVILYDKAGNQIIKLGGLLSPMEIGEKTQFTLTSTLDYANAYDFTIKIK